MGVTVAQGNSTWIKGTSAVGNLPLILSSARKTPYPLARVPSVLHLLFFWFLVLFIQLSVGFQRTAFFIVCSLIFCPMEQTLVLPGVGSVVIQTIPTQKAARF